MSDSQNAGHGARLLAIETALRVLIDEASTVDPALRNRIRMAVDAYLATIPVMSEVERNFIERSREFTEFLVRPVHLPWRACFSCFARSSVSPDVVEGVRL